MDSNTTDRIGKVMIITASILTLNVYFIIFTITIYLFGVGIIWGGEQTIKAKLLWTISPIAFLLTLYLLIITNVK